MSIQLMTLVRKSALPTNTKFVLMALADWADDNGVNCYPSIYELSEYMTCSERTVQRLLRELEEGGWIAVVGNANGGGSSRHYALNVSKLEAVAEVEHARREAEKERRRRDRKNDAANPFNQGCQFVTPVNLSPVTTTTSRGDTCVTPSTIDPPKIHQRSVIGAGAPKNVKATGRATILPGDFWPNEAAEQMARDFGLSLADQLAAFQDHHSAKGSTFKDWQAAFRTWLRNSQRFGQRSTPMASSRHGQQGSTHKHAAAYATILEA